MDSVTRWQDRFSIIGILQCDQNLPNNITDVPKRIRNLDKCQWTLKNILKIFEGLLTFVQIVHFRQFWSH